jgi:hypothetical protein
VGPVAGTWLGPSPGDTGGCGTSYGEFVLQDNGAYSFTSQSMDCGGFTLYGHYHAGAGTITFHQQQSTCPTCTLPADYSVTYQFVDPNSMSMCDEGGGGRCYTYHRQ